VLAAFFASEMESKVSAQTHNVLRSPFQAINKETNKQNSLLRKCPRLTRPIEDMSGMFQFYKSDKTQSVIDRKLMSLYMRKIWPISELKKNLSKLSIFIMSNNSNDRLLASKCIIEQILLWADKDAMLYGFNQNTALGQRQAILEIIWASVAMANAYELANIALPVDDNAKARITTWFSRINKIIKDEFTPRERAPKDKWLDAHANHWLWAGASVSALSIILQDHASFDWSMNILMTSLREAPMDGGLPQELKRGQRALHYQSFAMAAISIMVAAADINGIDFDRELEKKLRSLSEFSLNSFLHPVQIEKITGKKQEKKSFMIIWASPMAYHYINIDKSFSILLNDTFNSVKIEPEDECSLVCATAYTNRY
jgi:hypothetical protein